MYCNVVEFSKYLRTLTAKVMVIFGHYPGIHRHGVRLIGSSQCIFMNDKSEAVYLMTFAYISNKILWQYSHAVPAMNSRLSI